MKKKLTNLPKPKEFATSPFAKLKGVTSVNPEAPPVEAKPEVPGRETAADDMDLFLLAMQGVNKLGTPAAKKSAETAVSPFRATVRRIDANEQQLFLDAISDLKLDVRFDVEERETPLPKKPAAVSRMKQLRRGTIRLDYELDLHGLTEEEALAALDIFVRGAFRRGQKAVLIITGKGNHSPEEPVLKPAVDSWLRQEGEELVVEFLSAPARMGGEGAVVVFLRQKEETSSRPD